MLLIWIATAAAATFAVAPAVRTADWAPLAQAAGLDWVEGSADVELTFSGGWQLIVHRAGQRLAVPVHAPDTAQARSDIVVLAASLVRTSLPLETEWTTPPPPPRKPASRRARPPEPAVTATPPPEPAPVVAEPAIAPPPEERLDDEPPPTLRPRSPKTGVAPWGSAGIDGSWQLATEGVGPRLDLAGGLERGGWAVGLAFTWSPPTAVSADLSQEAFAFGPCVAFVRPGGSFVPLGELSVRGSVRTWESDGRQLSAPLVVVGARAGARWRPAGPFDVEPTAGVEIDLADVHVTLGDTDRHLVPIRLLVGLSSRARTPT